MSAIAGSTVFTVNSSYNQVGYNEMEISPGALNALILSAYNEGVYRSQALLITELPVVIYLIIIYRSVFAVSAVYPLESISANLLTLIYFRTAMSRIRTLIQHSCVTLIH